MIYMTGNNLAIVGEQGRRTVLCRMDAKEEQPEQRTFATDPIETVLKDRGRYIADILIIARAYHRQRLAPPTGLHPFGSYPEWSRFVREPLVLAGAARPGPVAEGRPGQRPGDQPAARHHRRVARRLRHGGAYPGRGRPLRHHPCRSISGYDRTIPRTRGRRARRLPHPQGASGALLAALREAFPAGRDGINTHALGNWMRASTAA